MDGLEGRVEWHRQQPGLQYFVFNHGNDGPLGGGDFAPGYGPQAPPPRRPDDFAYLQNSRAGVLPKIEIPPAMQQPDQWLPDARFEPMSPMKRTPFEEPPLYKQPLNFWLTEGTTHLQETGRPPLMRVDRQEEKDFLPMDHMQYGFPRENGLKPGSFYPGRHGADAYDTMADVLCATRRPWMPEPESTFDLLQRMKREKKEMADMEKSKGVFVWNK